MIRFAYSEPNICMMSSNTLQVIIVEADGGEAVIEDIAAVVLATGFEPSPSLAFLPQE